MEKGFFQDGFIVQAEEVQVNGRWQRYYGFEGANRIAKVPAEEIDFVANDYYRYRRWLRIAGKFEARLAPPKGTVDPDELGPPRRVVGETIPVQLTVRNAGGLEDAVPDLNRRVRFRAWYSPAEIAPQGMLVPSTKENANWEEVTSKAREFSRDISGRTSLPGGKLVVDGINLAEWFEFTRPGFYRISLVLADSPEDSGEAIIFSLAPAP